VWLLIASILPVNSKVAVENAVAVNNVVADVNKDVPVLLVQNDSVY